ncbi:MAG TPA: hypothetical protein VFV19_01380 [Candidatus Polarisedimenticolaceae bacterium]|nr:hypothetical protein [Candidatus Polarisedimenticolaceae bacterium]
MTTFEILPGLPGKGPRAKPFSATQKAWLQAGYVVQFTPKSGNSWVGNFQPGPGGATKIVLHPDGTKVVVVTSGQMYVVDPDARTASVVPGIVLQLHAVADPPLLVSDDQGIQFQAFGPEGVRWRTRRISWSGFRKVVLSDGKLTAEASNVTGDTWERFEVDLRTGRTTGGTYQLGDAALFEKISEGGA